MSETEGSAAMQGAQEIINNHAESSRPVSARQAISRPVFMPEVYTGVGREWSDWIEQFELASTVNSWDDSVKLQFLSLLLSGRAREMYNGLSAEAKQNYATLKAAMTRSLEPCCSNEWSRVAFSERRLPNETGQEFGNALRRLVRKAYPSLDDNARDMLARDHFVTHFASGDFRVGLKTAKPKTLESAVNLATEMELLRKLEHSGVVPDARVREVTENKSKVDERLETLLGVVEGLCQEVKTIQSSVQALQRASKTPSPSVPPNAPGVSSVDSRAPFSKSMAQGVPKRGVCWECGCDRHLRRDCPYIQGN